MGCRYDYERPEQRYSGAKVTAVDQCNTLRNNAHSHTLDTPLAHDCAALRVADRAVDVVFAQISGGRLSFFPRP